MRRQTWVGCSEFGVDRSSRLRSSAKSMRYSRRGGVRFISCCECCWHGDCCDCLFYHILNPPINLKHWIQIVSWHLCVLASWASCCHSRRAGSLFVAHGCLFVDVPDTLSGWCWRGLHFSVSLNRIHCLKKIPIPPPWNSASAPALEGWGLEGWGPRRVGASKVGRPEGWRAQNFACFPFSCAGSWVCLGEFRSLCS